MRRRRAEVRQLFQPGETTVSLIAKSRSHRAWYASTDCKRPGHSVGYTFAGRGREEHEVHIWMEEGTIWYSPDSEETTTFGPDDGVKFYSEVALNLPRGSWWTRKRKGEWFVTASNDKWGVFISAYRTKFL